MTTLDDLAAARDALGEIFDLARPGTWGTTRQDARRRILAIRDAAGEGLAASDGRDRAMPSESSDASS